MDQTKQNIEREEYKGCDTDGDCKSEGIEMLKDLAKDLKDSYNDKPEFILRGNVFWTFCQRIDLIIGELER